nr:hypothetical protein [Micromonospora sp. WMMC415]
MNEPGVGRSGGLTDWHLMDVASMWACLKDQDTTNQWRHVAGWRKVCDLAQAHLGRLQAYRRGLAEAWPPDTNAAARTYLAELDQLIDRVQHTHDAAAANYTALAAATQAIGSTRTALEKIHDEYAVKLQQKRSYEATAADPKAVAGSRVSEPPVTDADLERLNVQARGIMYGLSSELQQAQVALRQPPPARQPGRAPEATDPYVAVPSPVIPPIMPVPLAGASLSSPTPSKSTPRPFPTSPNPKLGPLLGGAAKSIAPAAINPNIPGAGQAGSANSPSLGALPNSPISGRPNNPGSSHLGRPVVSRPNNKPHATQPPVPRAMPPGGLIGGLPGAGLGQPASGGTQPRRVNPIGGVIGGGGAGTAPAGGAGSRPGGARGFPGAHVPPPITGSSGIPTAMGQGATHGQAARRNEPSVERTWDPDHPWETDRGVDPVVLPPKDEGPIDPGPAIGFTR